MNDNENHDQKDNLIYSIIDILKKMVYPDNWIKLERKLSNKDSTKKKFIAALCTSCNGDSSNIYSSFNYINQTDNLKDLKDLQITIAQLKEILRIYGRSYEKVSREYESLRIEVENRRKNLIDIEKECNELSISKPQFQKKIENFLKSSDRSEKNHQIILDDLTYLIDRLNRFMNYK